MLKYFIKRLLIAIPTVLGVFVVVFFVIRLIPGDPALNMLGPNASDLQIATYNRVNGLDQPITTQFIIALGKLIKGDLGDSFSLGKPVTTAIAENFPYTAELAILGIIIGSVLAVILGTYAAVHRNKWQDVSILAFSTAGTSMPTFFIGLWVLVILSSKLNIIPVLSNKPGVAHWKSLLGPLVTVVIGSMTLLMRTTRSSMLEIFSEDFIRTARSKGLSERIVLYKHALGNALIPIVTIVGHNLGTAFGGAIVLETVFTRMGMGKLLVDAINVRDYALVQGTTIFIAILMILINILTDMVYSLIDPRIRVSGEET
ncbi:MAG: ABC transporter permease [Lachnospiraceae bacterium]|jgi:ABC-type dipeptide/oligopeptide/nickel transport system permease component|nr:ABC transporter permease [Lachnospiraceae bacterium]